MALYFLLFFGIDLLFYAGSYNYGADVRYSLMTYPPLAVLGGLGAARLVRVLCARHGLPARTLIVTALAFQFLWYAPLVRATTEEAWAARADVRFAQALRAGLPPNSYVLTHNPGMFHLWGIKRRADVADCPESRLCPIPARAAIPAGSSCTGTSGAMFRTRSSRSSAARRWQLGTVELVREYRERDQRFALYRIMKPPS